MATKILGLDIRRDSVTGVLVETTLQGNRVKGLARMEIPKGETPAEKALSQSLSQLLEKLEIGGEGSDYKCFASLTPEDISIRNIRVPFDTDKKIRAVLPFELEPLLPIPIEDVVLDFQVIKNRGPSGSTDLVVMGAEKKRLDSSIAALGENEITPETMTMSGYPSAVVLSRFADFYGDYVFADFDNRRCTIYIIVSGQICFIRSFSPLEESGREIKRTLLSFREEFDFDFHMERVIWTGCVENPERVIEGIRKSTGLEVLRADLLSHTGITIADELKRAWKPGLFDNGLAIAYAGISGMNYVKFYEESFAAGKYVEKYKEKLFGTAVLALLLVVVFFSQLLINGYVDRRRIEELDRKMTAIYMEAFPESKRVKRPLETMRGKVKEAKKEAEFASSGEESVRIVDILNDMSRALPENLDIEFTRFAVAKGSVKISGFADTFSTVNEMKSRLEKVPYFKQVTIGSSTKEKGGQLFRFRLVIDL